MNPKQMLRQSVPYFNDLLAFKEDDMKYNHWKRLFSSKILSRGRDYFERDLVEILECDEIFISAIVSGTDDYEVEIGFIGNEIDTISCTCPYADDGNECKHMAAVLYAWEHISQAEMTESASPKNSSLETAIDKLPAETVRKLLLEKAREDCSLRDRIILYASDRVSRQQKKSWEKELCQLQKSCSIYEMGYEDEDDIVDYFTALIDFLNEKAEPLIEKGFLTDVYDLICAVYDQVNDIEYEDYDGLFDDLILNCQRYLQQIIDRSDMEQKHKFYQDILTKCNGKISIDNDGLWQDVLVAGFSEEAFLKRTLLLLEQALEGTLYEKNENWIVRLVKAKANVMRKLHFSEAEILEFRKIYRHYADIRMCEINEATEQGNIDVAIGLLLESKQLDVENHTLVQEYTLRLIELYEQQNDREKYIEELKYFVFRFPQHSLEYIQKLKSVLQAEEWQLVLQKLLDAPTVSFVRHELMAEEELYRELLNELEKEPSLYGLRQYEQILKEHFPEELRDVFFAYLRQEMSYSRSRSTYENLVARLKRMKSYPDGEQMARALADEWKTMYRSRSAMLEELKNAGF